MNNIYLALESLLTRYANLFRGENAYDLPVAIFSPPWSSQCIVEQINDQNNQHCYWKVVEKDSDNIFQDIESALDQVFHKDFINFYSAFWSNGICVEREDINFKLIQTWNEEDQEQLKENILGHCFSKLKARLPLTLFIGCTFGDEIISLENESGQIVLERPGRKPHKVLSQNLEQFLLSLSPTKDIY